VKYLKNCWYQAGWSEELGAGAALARTIAEVPLMFMRDGAGRPAALMDRCAHRFAPLSAGRIHDGRVTCGYHGLSFDASGQCVHNPHGGITGAMKVASFPVVERHSALWVWLGVYELADAARIPDLSYIDGTPPGARIFGYLPAKANYELLTDNILDLSHADYLHPASLGGMMTTAKTTNRAEGDDVVVEWDAVNCEPPGAFQGLIPPPQKGDIWIQVRWTAPAVMTLATFAAPAGTPRTAAATAVTLHNMTPESPGTTHYFYCSTRPYRIEDAEFTRFLRGALEQAFASEDKPMLEKQQARMGDRDFWSLSPVLLSVDAAAVRARRKLKQLVEGENPPEDSNGVHK
jgi:phenylpropionate dioxygenase-like ring-hydroxylating dioxygenase large terminal subunit